MISRRQSIKTEIYQSRLHNRNDSFWYGGAIGRLTLGRRQVYIQAVGDIRIANAETGELCWDNSGERGSGIPGLVNDKTLSELVGDNCKYRWDNNNWFELSIRLLGRDMCEDATIEPEYEYTHAIGMAKDILEDDEFWDQFEEDK